MYYRGFNYKKIRESIVNHKEVTISKSIKSLLWRKNSILLRAVIEMVSRGKSNKEVSMVLGIELTTWNRYIGKDEALRHQLHRARMYRNIMKHEEQLRKYNKRACKV